MIDCSDDQIGETVALSTRVTGDQRIRLDEIDPGTDGGLSEDQANGHRAKLTSELRELQELVYAAESNAVLVILQGMDAAGKDVAIANVFDATNPQSCRVKAFKPRTDEEAAHDFLWRAHAAMPKLGELVILDRSYYEQLVAERVTGEATDAIIRRRYQHVTAFERLLGEDGKTIVVKFFLHVSAGQQGKRLEERQENRETAWKISGRDWISRDSWDDYMAAYQDAINACATGDAPWYVVPADHEWVSNLAVAEIMIERLRPYRATWEEGRDRRGEENRAEAEQAQRDTSDDA
jgi:PPK2 family polyphosphate:nucleotide phosphotransferase